MTKLSAVAVALGLTASSAFAGGYVAPVVDVEPVVVDTKPASTNAGLVIPALRGFAAAGMTSLERLRHVRGENFTATNRNAVA